MRKATVFITRETTSGREVLVFHHPVAGIQLPAGTLEDGESFADAALREAREEAGVLELKLGTHLGTLELTFAGEQRRVITDVDLLEAPDGTPIGKSFERGTRVLFHEARAGYAYVTHDAIHDPYYPYPGVNGWVTADAVQPHCIVRQLFQLTATVPLPDKWEYLAEGQYLFRYFWVNVNNDPHLIESQQVWWDAMIEKLR